MKKFIEELSAVYESINPNIFTKFDIRRDIKEVIPPINISESIFGSWINIINEIVCEDQIKESNIIKIKINEKYS